MDPLNDRHCQKKYDQYCSDQSLLNDLLEARLNDTPPGPMPSSLQAPVTSDSAEWITVPGFEILRELQRGGQGIVYLALQRSTRQTVAIKVMLGGSFAGPHARARFAREVQILAELRHPNIVTIHDSGSTGDAGYFVMDYVEGRPLDRFVAETAPPLRARLSLFARI